MPSRHVCPAVALALSALLGACGGGGGRDAGSAVADSVAVSPRSGGASTGGLDSVSAPAPDPAAVAAGATFQGVLPCADCPGIDLTLRLFPDSAFVLRQVYRDRSPETTWQDTGHWSTEGDTLTLHGVGDDGVSIEPTRYRRFGWDSLALRDGEGKVIRSELNYTLRRVPGSDSTRYDPDSAQSGQRPDSHR